MNLVARIGTPLTAIRVQPDAESDFDRQLIEDADQFGVVSVPMTYKPYGGGARSITGTILYEGSELVSQIDGVTLTFVISVANNSTTGISSDEVTEGGRDKITIEPRINITATDRPIHRIFSQDAGMMQLEIR